jgi:predicted ribosomally synthesized peptide with SipW-like signal peptide
MALTTSVSVKELERIASVAYEGETIKVMLCSVGITGLTSASTVASWTATEQVGNGYARFSVVLGTGAYSTIDGRYNLPVVDAVFSATGVGYSYDKIVIYIEGSVYPHSVITESPNIVLLAGQTQTYRITLASDD